MQADQHSTNASMADKHKERTWTAVDVYNRIKEDPSLDTNEFTVCFESHFLGLIEVHYESYDPDDVPFRRVKLFKHLGKIVWDRDTPSVLSL